MDFYRLFYHNSYIVEITIIKLFEIVIIKAYNCIHRSTISAQGGHISTCPEQMKPYISGSSKRTARGPGVMKGKKKNGSYKGIDHQPGMVQGLRYLRRLLPEIRPGSGG